ncbi:hypothetical protein L3Q82_011639 [Scortum barcoo]|uniref:Uncharacterized protein n=1 Tax=Scortum barcoo TaxID=214431 RepID=A0ACB8W5L5_9TELE|nr:hypothetical protein L3Q82_011639 [Scortum barcoo]
MDLDIRQYLAKAKEQHDCGALQAAYRLMKGRTAAAAGGRTPHFDPELRVVCAEAALQLGCLEISAACLKMYFEGNPPANQFLCRAYLCQGQLKSPPATGRVEDFEEAVLYFLKAIEISKRDPRYSFMVFNASVLYFQTVRPLLQPGRCLHLVPSLRQVVQSLEEVADKDHSWRAELMMQVHHKLTEDDVLIEMSMQCTALTVIYKIQKFKNRLEDIKEDERTKVELEQIFHFLVDCTKVSAPSVSSSPLQSPTPIQPADRVAFLLELALLALQVKHQRVAADCLKELKTVGDASIGQRIIMECVNCEINLLKREAKMNDYSKASVEARLKEIGKLDQWLQTAVREGEPQAMQAVCATQWSFCLPLLQHNLRKRIKTPLLNVAQVLEDTHSMLLEMRCQVHSELAVIEEEEGRLEASLTHLQKALLLDNGTQHERLLSALRLLQLRGTLYQTPSRTEDKAAMLMQQARDMLPKDKTDIRPVLIAVGLLLAPHDFQMVLDADNTSKSKDSSASLLVLTKTECHFILHVCSDYTVVSSIPIDTVCCCALAPTSFKFSLFCGCCRVKLWATLVKTARKQEVWDVCRAACRFCLLYDDGRWKIAKTDSLEVDVFFLTQATVQKLLTERVQLNSPPIPAMEGEECVSEDDPHWCVYRDWIQALSAYATFNFLRAAELGAEIRESWVVANAAIYLWNYSSHLLVAGEYHCLLPTFQRLVEMLRETEYTGNRALFVLLCDAVARGLIQPLCGPESIEPAPPVDKGKNRAEKGMEKASSTHGAFSDPSALQDVRKAAELCDYALSISNSSIPGETVSIAARKQVVATWVQIKRLLQQQVGSMMEAKDECENEEVSAMTRVLVGVEMLQCNRNPRHMEFSVPSLSTLVSMASECSWTDAVVELQVWCQLAAFCHYAKDHSLVLCCTKSALQLEEAAAKSLNTVPCVLYGPTAVNEMLSSATCLRGLSLVHESNGDLHAYREAMKVLLSSVSYAVKAEDPALCFAAARHYWNTCLPLTKTPEERWQLQKPLEKILIALANTIPKYGNVQALLQPYSHILLNPYNLVCFFVLVPCNQGKVKGLLTLTALPLGSSKLEATVGEEDQTLRVAIYSLLLHIHIDKTDWKSALQLLDQALRDMPPTSHRLALLKYRILVKARLGESVLMDMQKLEDEGEQCCSFMWHRVALCAGSITQQLTYYQKSITSLSSVETQWQKVSLLLEFGEWLHCHNFSKADAQHQVQWAIDILLHLETEQTEGAEDKSQKSVLSSGECESLVGVQGLLFTQSLVNLKEVRCLDSLVRAHTLLAVLAGKTSPDHQLNLLRAYNFVLQIWQVSMAVACEISIEMAKSQSLQPPPSAGSKIGKDKGKGKKVKDAQSLFYLNLLEKELHSLLLDHLTLPIMHLAEVIAHDLLDRKSLSDFYQLRIMRTCCRLGLVTHSPYQKKILILSRIQEQEQMGCRRAIALSQERGLHKAYNQNMEENSVFEQQSMDVCAQDIWLDKAEVCLSMGLYQPARQLLADAHLVAMELGDQKAMARSLLSLAILACEEQNYAQALILLDKAQALGGDEEFWYQLTLTKVTAILGQREKNAHSKTDQIIKQGCGALKLALERRVNRVPKLRFLITSLEMRGAIECVRSLGGDEPGETLSTEAVQRLMAACDTLRECASGFKTLGYREQAAEAHVEYAQGLRILAKHTSRTKDKKRFLLDGVSQMQLAVTEQEHVMLNVQRLLISQQESHGLSLAATRRLQRLRLTLAEFCLAVLEERCAEEKLQALAREKKTPAEIALEEFTRCTPEPNSIEQEWASTGSTLGQVALGQLAAVTSNSPDNIEARASCLSMMGKYLRLLAVQEDPIYLCTFWDKCKQKGPWSDPKAASVEDENSEKEKDRESSRREPRVTSAKNAELQQLRRHRAKQLLDQASKALAEAINLCLQHKLPCSILAEASLNMLECHGQSDPAVAGQYLALFQSCCTVATMAEVLSSACAGTGVSQLSALLSLHRKLLLSHEERPSSMLKGVEDSLNSISKAFSHLTICPSHLNILSELPPNLKILLLQHSGDGPQSASLPVPEVIKTKDKEEKGSSAEPGECLVLLADRKLLELPLEALSVLHVEGLGSVSRDFSLQLLHSRLNREEPEKEGTSLSRRMQEILEVHSQHFTQLWEGFMGSKQTPSLSEMEQLLCRCSAFIFLGMERFMANIPPAKLAALDLSGTVHPFITFPYIHLQYNYKRHLSTTSNSQTPNSTMAKTKELSKDTRNKIVDLHQAGKTESAIECRMALLFDLVQNNASVLRQSNLDMHKSAEQFVLEKPLETALLLSLGGVSCVVLNQWHSSFQQNTRNMFNVIDNLLRVRQTSGQTIHSLRKGDSSGNPHHKGTGSYDQVLLADSKKDVYHKTTLTPSAFNCILYGLPNLIVM